MTDAPTREVWIVTDNKFGRRIGGEYATKREARAAWPSYSRYAVHQVLCPAVEDASDGPGGAR